jgi:hypothetical protein
MSEHEAKERAKKNRLKMLEDEVKAIRFTWPPGNQLVHERFFVVHFEYFVKTQEGLYLPCEVSGVEFSLQEVRPRPEGLRRRHSGKVYGFV